MKLALYLPNFRDLVTVKELEDLTSLAEELDFDSVWTLDRIVVPEASDEQKLQHPFGMMEQFPKALPVSAATHWFPAERFAALPDAVRASGSVTAGLSACGVDDYLRAETVVEAEHASARDRSALGLAPGAIVLTARAVNVDRAGFPVQYSLTRFAADRVTHSVAHDAPG